MIFKFVWFLIDSLISVIRYIYNKKFAYKSESYIEVNLTNSPNNGNNVQNSK